jgi:phosphomannomutase
VILPDVHLGRDASVGIGLILQLLADAGTSLSELKASMPHYAIAKGKMDVGSMSPDVVLARLRDRNANRGTINTDDGLRIDFDDCWVHMRKSNTEPIVRVIAEAATLERARMVVEEFRGAIVACAHE